MKAYEYRENGEVIGTFSTSIPGLRMRPVDKKFEDAIPISQEKYKEHIEAIQVENELKQPRDLAKELDELKIENTNLKGEIEKLKEKTNGK